MTSLELESRFDLDDDAPTLGAPIDRDDSGVRDRASSPVRANSAGLRLPLRWLERQWLPATSILVALALWELAPRLGWLDRQFFSPPSQILAAGVALAKTGELFVHIGASLARTFAGLLAALATAIPLGLVLGGWFPRATNRLRGLFELLSQINAFSLFPLFVLFFGIGELAKFLIIYWSCLWGVLAATLSGVASVDPLLVKSARSMACGPLTLLREVLFPAALPAVLAGARIGATFAFLMLAAAEMIGAHSGLGWLVHNAACNYRIPVLYLAAVVIAALGAVLERTLNALEHGMIRWKPDLRVE